MTRTHDSMTRTALLAAIALAPAGLAGVATADDVNAVWTGAVDQSWTNPLNWSPSKFFPNNGAGGDTYFVFIDDAPGVDSMVELMGVATVSGLTLDLGDRIDVFNNADLRLAGDAINNGVIEIGSTGNVTELIVSAPAVTFGGAGELRLSNEVLDRITGSSFGFRIINGVDHTIRGGGSVGLNVIAIDNFGLLEATDGLTMIVDPNSGANTNTGTMRATNGGMLVIRPGAFDGTGGLIEAGAGSEVRFEGATVLGGELRTLGDGVNRVGSGTAVLTDVANFGLLEVENNGDLNLSGTMVNDGTIRTASTGNVTEILLGTSEVIIDGRGEIVLGGDGSLDRVTGSTFGNQLTHGPSHVIRGAGALGVNVINIDNQGLIVADTPGGSLNVDPNATLTNTGVLRAASGSFMQLQVGTYQNAGGLIEVEDDAEMQLSGATIVAGDLVSLGTGVFTVGPGNAFLDDVAFTGILEVGNNRDLNLSGTFVNEGTVRTVSDGNVTEIRIGSEGSTFTGTGEIVLGGNGTLDRITGLAFGTALTHDASHTIRGGGGVGANVINIFNDGLIVADDPKTPLSIDPNATLTNTGVLRAASGSVMDLQIATYQNDGGLIEAQDGAEVVLNGATIVGGDVDALGSGMFSVGPGNAFLADLEFTGLLEVGNNRDLNLAGTVVNDGVIRTAADGNVTEIRIGSAPATVAGSGEIVLGGGTNTDRLTGVAFGTDFTNGPAHTIRGGGLLGSNVLDIINQGTVIADEPGGLLRVDANGDLVNEGLMRVLDGSTMDLPVSTFIQMGDIVVESGGIFDRTGTITQTAGTSLVDGTATILGGVFDVQGGALRGTGTVAGDVVNGGFVQPGIAEDFAVGTLTVDGDFDQNDTGTLFIQIGKPGQDRLDVTGTATLGGSLLVGFEKTFVPVPGTEYVILTAGAVESAFIFANCPAGYVIEYGDEQVSITITENISIADLDCNGVVDFNDLLLLLPGYGPCPGGGVPCRADVDASGEVDFNDLLILLSAWS